MLTIEFTGSNIRKLTATFFSIYYLSSTILIVPVSGMDSTL